MTKPYKLNESNFYNIELKNILPAGIHSNYLHQDKISTIHFKRGVGSRLWDLDGNEYLDLCGKYGSQFLGHNNQTYNNTLIQCIQSVLSVNLTDIDYEVSTYLHNNVKCCDMVRFNLSGSEAIYNAIRLARAYTGKQKIIRFEGHFHGSTNETIYANSNNIVTLQWNSGEILTKYLRKNHTEIGAIIMEPLCMSSGGIIPAEGYLQTVRKLCDTYQIVLIFDEVITGVRTALGGLQEIYDVIPDLSVFAKSLGNGIPISAIMGKKDIMQKYENHQVIHGGTYNGYPLGLSAILATFRILNNKDNEYYSKLKNINDKMIELLYRAASYSNLDIYIQGENNCYALNCSPIQITRYSQWNTPLQYRNNILRGCLQRYGVILAPTSRIYTNISFNEDDLDFLVERSRLAFCEAAKILTRINK